MNYFCCDELRRRRMKGRPFNGIDYLEVLDHDASVEAERQRVLFVHLINPLSAGLAATNIRIEGGERIVGLRVVAADAPVGARVVRVEVNRPGDFSLYTLRIVRGAHDADAPEPFDPLFAAVEFSFKVECPTDFDCRPRGVCPPEVRDEPDIDYLAKDYASLRRLMLDRMAALIPAWRERNPADLGIALVELLAYVGDHLSYQQDAIATEAYLGTARRRVSVRRHARLVDYFMHDGANARTWVHVTVAGADHVVLPQHTKMLTRMPEQPRRLGETQLTGLLKQHPTVFETMQRALLFEAHNELRFYTWGDQRCCLPRGATRATLRDDSANRVRLRAGDVLIFEERLGPNTGLAADADPKRRHAVRLTRVVPEAESVYDESGAEVNRIAAGAQMDNVVDPATAYVEIEWAAADALPFPFCLSSTTDEDHGPRFESDVSIARGNLVLADHGMTVAGEDIGEVPPPVRTVEAETTAGRCAPRERVPVAARFRPTLQQQPVTQARALDDASSATAMLRGTDAAVPALSLTGKLEERERRWSPRRDLLASGPDSADFVLEIDHDGVPTIRFGNGVHGLRPVTKTAFTADYRVGNGVVGNVGAEALWHVVSADPAIAGIRNPLPAAGGREPETMEEVRQRAPSAYRTQLRAVIEADYAEMAEKDPSVQRATAALRWTGSWHTMFVTTDRFGGDAVDPSFEAQVVANLEQYRMAGQDVEVDAPVFVPLELELHVCVQPGYFRSEIKRELLDLFSNRVLPDGRRGLFHPDNLTFGQKLYLSPLYAAAQAVPGVASVHITGFKRRGAVDNSAVDTGFLQLSRTEVAQLDNDRNFAERGVLKLTLGGGK